MSGRGKVEERAGLPHQRTAAAAHWGSKAKSKGALTAGIWKGWLPNAAVGAAGASNRNTSGSSRLTLMFGCVFTAHPATRLAC